MIYYDDGIILIRTLVPDDAQILAEEEQFQGDHVTREKYDMRLQDQAEGKAVALAAEYQGQTAGYICKKTARQKYLSLCRAVLFTFIIYCTAFQNSASIFSYLHRKDSLLASIISSLETRANRIT